MQSDPIRTGLECNPIRIGPVCNAIRSVSDRPGMQSDPHSSFWATAYALQPLPDCFLGHGLCASAHEPCQKHGTIRSKMLCTGISLLASDNQDHAGFVVQIRPSVPEYAVARMPPAGLEDRDQLAHAKYAPERAFFGAPVA